MISAKKTTMPTRHKVTKSGLYLNADTKSSRIKLWKALVEPHAWHLYPVVSYIIQPSKPNIIYSTPVLIILYHNQKELLSELFVVFDDYIETYVIMINKGDGEMTFIIEDSKCIFAMSSENDAVMRVPDGAEVIFKTKDALDNQIRSEDVSFESLDWDHVNPASGPVYVEGAEPGDVLCVKIKDIRIGDQATMITGPGLGVASGQLKDNFVKVMPVKNGFVEFSEQIKVPIRPMIGVIGVAPAPNEGSINCGTPDAHGGNMDCKEITAGVSLYLPVNVPGAGLAMGDLHAVMADGEVSVCGAEIPGEVTVEVSVLKGKPLPTPLLVNKETVMTIASAETLDEAAELAALNAAHLIMDQTEMPLAEAISLLSLAGNLAICQVVDPLKTARMEMPKSVFNFIKI